MERVQFRGSWVHVCPDCGSDLESEAVQEPPTVARHLGDYLPIFEVGANFPAYHFCGKCNQHFVEKIVVEKLDKLPDIEEKK